MGNCLLQFNHGTVAVSWFAVACERAGNWRLAYCPLIPEFGDIRVEMVEAGETVDSKKSQ